MLGQMRYSNLGQLGGESGEGRGGGGWEGGWEGEGGGERERSSLSYVGKFKVTSPRSTRHVA